MAKRQLLVGGSFAVQFGDDLQSRDHLQACKTRSRRFSRASGRLHAFASSVDWLIGLATSFMVGQRDVIGFGFTIHN